jgi:hypothetical protein
MWIYNLIFHAYTNQTRKKCISQCYQAPPDHPSHDLVIWIAFLAQPADTLVRMELHGEGHIVLDGGGEQGGGGGGG